MTRITDLLRDGTRQLAGEDARHEVEQLLVHVLGRDRAWLFAHGDETPEDQEIIRFQALLARRVAGEPLAYLIGRRGFWTLELEVTPATLIPRPETELLIELALARFDGRHGVWRVADLGTGSGAIALSLASEWPMAEILATDLSGEALDVAARNARGNGIGHVRFVQGDWFGPLQGQRFDLIVSNPPYIAQGDPHLDRGDLRYEPTAALASGADGLDAIRLITASAPAHLNSQGELLFEHGHDQGTAVRALLQAAGFVEVRSARDLEQRERATYGRWPG